MLRNSVDVMVFDWDGVLCNSHKSHKRAKEILKKEFGDLAEETGGKNAREFLTGKGASPETIEAYFRRWSSLEEEFGAPAHNGANELLQKINEENKTCGALSNRGHTSYNFRTFAASGINLSFLNFFVLYNSEKRADLHGSNFYDKQSKRDYLVSPYAKPHKSAAMPVNQILKSHERYPGSIIYVGDNIIDFKFAKENNFGFIGVLSGEIQKPDDWIEAGLKESNGDMIVKDIKEILDIF